MRELIRRHRIACFLVVTYAVTWTAWISIAATGARVGPGLSPAYLLGLVGPAAGAFVTTALADGTAGVRELAARMGRVRVGLRHWLLALGTPFAAYAACYVVLAAYSMFLLAPLPLPTWASLGTMSGFPITNAAVLFVIVLAINGFGEETGWRGFLVPALQRNHSPVVASLLVALCWAPWHAPAFFINETFRAMPVAMIPVFVLGLASGSLVLTWLYNRGGGSIALAAGFHAAYNLFTATAGSRGAIAAVETTVVMIAAAVLVITELRELKPRGARRRPRSLRAPGSSRA